MQRSDDITTAVLAIVTSPGFADLMACLCLLIGLLGIYCSLRNKRGITELRRERMERLDNTVL